MNATPQPTLYEDWQHRRAQLNEPVARLSEADRLLQIRILDYVLKRYVNDPVVRAPARFPMTTELYLNHRAMLVHRYLSCAPKVIVNDAVGAQSRVSGVLRRMKSRAAREDIGTPAGGAVLGRDENAPTIKEMVKQQIVAYSPGRQPLRRRIACETDFYDDPNDFYREKLMSGDVRERIGAARELAETGTLDDMNLFLELLALAECSERKLLPVFVAPPALPQNNLSPTGGIGAATRADRDDPPKPVPIPQKPLSEEEATAYRDELLDNFEDVTSVIQLLNEAGPPQLPLPTPVDRLPIIDATANQEASNNVVQPTSFTEPEVDERAVLEECAMVLAKREHKAR